MPDPPADPYAEALFTSANMRVHGGPAGPTRAYRDDVFGFLRDFHLTAGPSGHAMTYRPEPWGRNVSRWAQGKAGATWVYALGALPVAQVSPPG